MSPATEFMISGVLRSTCTTSGMWKAAFAVVGSDVYLPRGVAMRFQLFCIAPYSLA